MLEFLDGDALALVGRELALRQEHETIRALSDLPHQIVLLQPRRPAAAAASISHLSISLPLSLDRFLSRSRDRSKEGKLGRKSEIGRAHV